MTDLTTVNLMQKLHAQQSIPKDTEKFITNLTTLFIPNKQEKNKWAIYLVGHGAPSQSVSTLRTLLAQEKEASKIQKIKKQLTKAEASLSKMKNGTLRTTIPETAQIAGIDLQSFAQLMKFFSQNINTAFVYYTTCFGGGSHQALLNEVLSSLHANFIVVSEGIDETSTLVIMPSFIPNSTGRGLVLETQPFSQFFERLRLYIDKPEEFVKIKGERTEPLAAIINPLFPVMEERNQPFVRIPAVGTFGVLALDKSVKNLTQSIVKAHENEHRPINLSDSPEIYVVTIYPYRINVPLNLGSYQKIVAPTSKNISPSYEIIRIFKEINFENTLQQFIFNLISLNTRLNIQTFITKKLTGILDLISGLKRNSNQDNTIHNFILQTKGIVGTGPKFEKGQEPLVNEYITNKDIETNAVGANVTITFEFSGDIYQGSFGVKNFESEYESFDLSKITFTSTPIKTTNMEKLAQKFMPQEEVNKLQKPITLDSIVKYFDAKIDKQEIITPEMQEQSTIGLSALRK